MAEQPSKAFGEYQGSRINPIPEGFLSAYAQAAKNYAEAGKDLGEGVGKMIANYRAERETEDAYNNVTKSPQFLEQFQATMTSATSKAAELRKKLTAAGYDFDADEGDTSNPSAEGNIQLLQKPEIQNAAALLRSLENVRETGQAFLTSPDKFNNKKKAELIGTVSTAYKAIQDAAEREAKATNTAINQAATEAKTEATLAATARADAPNTDLRGVMRGAIAEATTVNPLVLESRLLELRNRAKAEQDKLGKTTQATLSEMASIEAYFDSNEAEAMAGPITASPFIKKSEAEKRLAAINERMATGRATQDDVEEAEELQSGLSNAEMDGSDEVYAFTRLSADQTRTIELNRRFNMAVRRIETQNDMLTKTGRLSIPPLSMADKSRLYTAIELGGLGIEAEDGYVYDVDKDGYLTTREPTKEEKAMRERQRTGTQTKMDEKRQLDIDKARQKVAAESGSRMFGDATVVYREVPTLDGTGTVRQSAIEPKSFQTVFSVQGRPDLHLSVSGRVNSDGKNNANVMEFRQKLADDQQTLNVTEQARRLLVAKNKDGTERIKTDDEFSEADKIAYVQALYELTRQMGKGLGPLSAGDYQLLERKFFAQFSSAQINFSDANAVRQFVNSVLSEQFKEIGMMESQMKGIQNDIMSRTKRELTTGMLNWAVDENEQRVGGGFAIKGAAGTDSKGQISTAYPIIVTAADGSKKYTRVDLTKDLDGLEKDTGPLNADRHVALTNITQVIENECLTDVNLLAAYQEYIQVLAEKFVAVEGADANKRQAFEVAIENVRYRLYVQLRATGMPDRLINAWTKNVEVHQRPILNR